MMLFLLAAATFVGNKPCAECHRNISRNFAVTRMAKAQVACEKCHGPGSEHIKGSDRMIYPPALEPARRDATCAQCHRASPQTLAFAQSKCRQTAWCATCHDVHKATVNQSACQDCHAEKQCHKGPACASCHMPKLARVTDHRLRSPSRK